MLLKTSSLSLLERSKGRRESITMYLKILKCFQLEFRSDGASNDLGTHIWWWPWLECFLRSVTGCRSTLLGHKKPIRSQNVKLISLPMLLSTDLNVAEF